MGQIPDISFASPVVLRREREYGFYWIRLSGDPRPIVAEWVGDAWFATRAHDAIDDDRVESVGERLPPPNQNLIPEYMRAVPHGVPTKMQAALDRLGQALGGR